MKKLLAKIIFGALTLASASSCGIIGAALQIKNETKYEPASVLLADGTVLEGSAVLPNGSTAELKFKDAEGNKQKIQSSDVECLSVWKEGFEDKKFYFFYREYLYYTHKKKGDMFRSMWMVPKASGEHLTVMAGAADYQFNNQGDLILVGETIPYYGFKDGYDYGTLINSAGWTGSSARKWAVDYLSDDPDLCQAISGKEIDPFDFDTICDEYNPQ